MLVRLRRLTGQKTEMLTERDEKPDERKQVAAI